MVLAGPEPQDLSWTFLTGGPRVMVLKPLGLEATAVYLLHQTGMAAGKPRT